MIKTISAIGENNWKTWLDKWFLPLIVLGVAVNATSLFCLILDSDGTLYAQIGKRMAQSGDWVNLISEGKDWLDKPHFSFWMMALSYKAFGYTSFAYKLPAFLFWGLGASYTYLLAEKTIGESAGKLASLLYVSSAHLFISNVDVRAEAYLMGMIIPAVYHIYCAINNPKYWGHILCAAFFLGLALMTKGPFVFFIVIGGVGADVLYKGQLFKLFNWKWLAFILLVGVFISPELYCLNSQFDMHPEKVVLGVKGFSGLRFFFWDGQFGRFFNNGPIKGEGDYFFFFHTLLWAFLPWSLMFYAAYYTKVRELKATKKSDGVAFWVGAVGFAIFSLSKFQLPYYTNILFPFFCILVADYLLKITSKDLRVWNVLQLIVVSCLAIIVLFFDYCFRVDYWIPIFVFVLLVYIAFFVFNRYSSNRGNLLSSVVGGSMLAALSVYVFLFKSFYPALFDYQSGSEAAFYANEHYEGKPVYLLATTSFSFDFYHKNPVPTFEIDSFLLNQKGEGLVYMEENMVGELEKRGVKIKVLKRFPFFHASQLTLQFINKDTRDSAIRWVVLAQALK